MWKILENYTIPLPAPKPQNGKNNGKYTQNGIIGLTVQFFSHLGKRSPNLTGHVSRNPEVVIMEVLPWPVCTNVSGVFVDQVFWGGFC